MDMTAETESYDDVAEALTRLAPLHQALHRPYLTYAGLDAPESGKQDESLLVTAHVSDTFRRCQQYALDTGIPAERLFSDPIVSIPLPIYEEADDRVVFGSTRPEAFWHPLAWLPEAQAMPATWLDEDGEPESESDREWAMRLALELAASGLYDPSQGWVDILALHGLDIATPAVVERVTRWLAGAADPTLDAIDLTPYFAATDTLYGRGWAHVRVEETFFAYRSAAWAVTARTLAEELRTVNVEALRDADARDVLVTIGAIAATYLDDVPTPDSADDDYPDRLSAITSTVDLDAAGDVSADTIRDADTGLLRILDEIVTDYADAETDLASAEADAIEQLDKITQGAAS